MADNLGTVAEAHIRRTEEAAVVAEGHNRHMVVEEADNRRRSTAGEEVEGIRYKAD